MKILTTDQIRLADNYTIENQPIESIELMEQASMSFVEAYLDLPVGQSPVTVVCGPGNNGGDGLAIARLLSQRNFEVEVWLIQTGSGLSVDCKLNLKRWRDFGTTIEINSAEQLKELTLKPVVIDAIFGSGISRGISGLLAEVIQFINESASQVISVDMPSGLFADQPNPKGEIVRADHTISFQVPKLAFFLPQNYKYAGDWQVVDIGLDRRFIDSLQSNWESVDQLLVSAFKRKQNRFAHKGVFGHALLVAGSKGKVGAAILAARAALRSGLGLLTVHIPDCGYVAMQTSVPEAMCQVDADQEVITEVKEVAKYQVIGIGPGLGQQAETVKSVMQVIQEARYPLVVDADALNIMSRQAAGMTSLPVDSILTPHPGEFTRLAGEVKDDYHRLQIQLEFARKFRVILIYKGAYTTVATPDGRLFFNTTGNPGMATAGSGDVLTGIITGLLARTRDPVLAAVVGVFLHGAAGDLAAEDRSAFSMTAGDIIDHIGAVIKKMNLQL
ncbi:MAG: bifunctional NAD(P)H-hydrate repair enzyme [Cyclobacteriaceae bacterium]|nr:MAG: bifunctional NAD(P)H-hydrate repair enzyme [Cyclobacteriaceae bacterium]